MADKRAKLTGRKGVGGGYTALPHAVTSSEDFRQLGGAATKLLLMIASQYRGSNNGDLQATHNLAKQWGISSEQTLSRALQELITKNLILKTREGVFLKPGGKCSLFAVTWQPIDPCNGKLDVATTKTAPRSFSTQKNTAPSTKTVATGCENCSHKAENGSQTNANDYEICSHTAPKSRAVATKTVDLSNLPRGYTSTCNHQEGIRHDPI